MKTLLVYNRQAGSGRHDAHSIVTRLEALGCAVTLLDRKEDAWKAAVRNSTGGLVVAAGGDGTVSAVARQLLGNSTPLLVLPLGTANNIASSFGSYLDVTRILESWKQWRPAAWSPLLVKRGKKKKKTFRAFEGVGTGVFASTMRELKGRDTPAGEKLQLARSVLQERIEAQKPDRLRLHLDGRSLEVEPILMQVVRTGFIGPRLRIGDEPPRSFGAINGMIATEQHRRALRNWVEEAGSSSAPGEYFSACSIRIEPYEPLALHIDDTPRKVEKRIVEISADPRAVHILRPDTD